MHTQIRVVATAVTDLTVAAASAGVAAAAVVITVVAVIATTCPTYVTLYALSSEKCLCGCEGALSVLIIRCLKMILHVSAYGYGFLSLSFFIHFFLFTFVEKRTFCVLKAKRVCENCFTYDFLRFHPLSTFFFIFFAVLAAAFLLQLRNCRCISRFSYVKLCSLILALFLSCTWFSIVVVVFVVVVESKYEHCMLNNKTHKIYLSSNKHKLKARHTKTNKEHKKIRNKSDINVTVTQTHLFCLYR